jgi:hypothetical protein
MSNAVREASVRFGRTGKLVGVQCCPVGHVDQRVFEILLRGCLTRALDRTGGEQIHAFAIVVNAAIVDADSDMDMIMASLLPRYGHHSGATPDD